MEIKQIKTDEQITHLALIGRLDLAGAEQVELKFTALVATRAKPCLIDLSDLEFIASLGLRMFLSCAKALKNKDAQLVLLKPTPRVLEILTSVGFDKLIPIENDLDKALKILKKNR
jgi:anti-anti-sigma factor